MDLSMNSQSLRIANQLRETFTGEPWHGPCLRALLSGVTAEQARSRPLPSIHGIWELVLHIDLWIVVACDATEGTPMPKLYGTEKDWPAEEDASAAAWVVATNHLFQSVERMALAMEGFADARLTDKVPGRDYDFGYLFPGVVHHSIHHGGQIAMLKRAL
jgi:hypothetical protein